MKLYKGITILFVLSMISFGTLASEKYCLKEETTKPIVVNIFGQSYQNNDDKRDFINGLNTLPNGLTTRDYLITPTSATVPGLGWNLLDGGGI